MSRLAKMVKESQSGPGLYIDGSGRIITLGTFYCFISELGEALEGAGQLIEELSQAATCSDYPHILMVKLAVQYAQALKDEIFPFSDQTGREFWADQKSPKKITFIDPFQKQITSDTAQKAKAATSAAT